MESGRSDDDDAASPCPGASSDGQPHELAELVRGRVLLVGEQWGRDLGTKVLHDFAREIGPDVHGVRERAAVSPSAGTAVSGHRPSSLSGEGSRGTKRKAEDGPEARRSESEPTVSVSEAAEARGPRMVFVLSRASSLRAQRPSLRHILSHVQARADFPHTTLVGVVVVLDDRDRDRDRDRDQEEEEEEEEARLVLSGLLASAFPEAGPQLPTAIFRPGRAARLLPGALPQGAPESPPPTPLSPNASAQQLPLPSPPPEALPDGPAAQARERPPSPEVPSAQAPALEERSAQARELPQALEVRAAQAQSWEETQAAIWAEAQGGPAPQHAPPPDGGGNRLLEVMSSKAAVLTAIGAAAVAAGAAGAAYYSSEH
ncbi:histone-lysine N-methyltransferase 2B-like isoform X1 [Tachyglossus aculeatus]|uniref:histone-lysine N-methyltransferase 2B-like isoform X1 n=1 Tax=Tachyglossus aculeatus TaxID=9261 RepID=UPI0018F3D4A3|nr:histone-lysine N-methyltransferase 2B-like isoform X1 [Tachyglossus aculeatus]